MTADQTLAAVRAVVEAWNDPDTPPQRANAVIARIASLLADTQPAAAPSGASDGVLPALPEPDLESTQCDSTMRYTTLRSYSRGQMIAYARAALAHPSEAVPEKYRDAVDGSDWRKRFVSFGINDVRQPAPEAQTQTKVEARAGLTDEQIDAGAAALANAYIGNGWAQAHEESKAVYRKCAKAAIEAAGGTGT